MSRSAHVVLAVALALPGQSALAQPIEIGQVASGYTYYNRPGAGAAEHNSELAACINDTEFIGAGGPTYQGLAFQMIWGGAVAGFAASRVENCMVVRGWRVVRLSTDEGSAMAGLGPDEFANRFRVLIGDEHPHGEIVRKWANEASQPTNLTTASRPAAPDNSQLSFRYYAASDPPAPAPAPPESWPKLDARWSTASIDPGRLSAPPTGAGVIVVRATTGGLFLEREGPSLDVRPSYLDRAPDLLHASRSVFAGGKDRYWFAFVVPPGRWRIAQAGITSFCFGAPSFEVRAGDVIYAGAFDIQGSSLGPDLNLEPAKAYLSGPLAESVKRAEYRNGSRGSCHHIAIQYAFEIPGAPFASDYHWGSLARSPGRAGNPPTSGQ